MTRRHLTIARLLPALAARRAQIGGQAVIEGVMMRGVDWWSLAVRRPDRSIGLHHFPLVSYMKKYPVLRLPVLRGVVALIESLVIGVRALTRSANESLGEEEEELGKKEIGITLVIAFAFAVACSSSRLSSHGLLAGWATAFSSGSSRALCGSRSSSSTCSSSPSCRTCAASSSTTAPST